MARAFMAAGAFLAVSVCAQAFAQEIIIWYDDAGVAHQAASRDDIPAEHRPQASGIMTTLNPAMAELAASEGRAIGSDPLIYNDGLGILQQFRFDLDMEQKAGYVLVGTKYNLVKAAAAAAARKGGKLGGSYVAKVNAADGLPVAFYSWGFQPVLMLLLQDGRIIKGEEGFEKDVDPGLAVPATVKTFPYESLDFSRPVEVQLYSREGGMVQLKLDLPAYR